METAGARASSWRRGIGIALVTIGATLSLGTSGARAEADSVALLSPGLGCGPAEGVIGAALLERVRGARQPHRAEAPPTTFFHAFYTCTQAVPAAVPVGMGWLATGPVRRG